MIIASHIGVHPKALLEYAKQDAETKAKIDERIAGYAGPVEFYVDRLAEGIATIAASVYPKPVIVRLSDFKSNERSEEHTSELQSLMRISYAVFCLKKKKQDNKHIPEHT